MTSPGSLRGTRQQVALRPRFPGAEEGDVPRARRCPEREEGRRGGRPGGRPAGPEAWRGRRGPERGEAARALVPRSWPGRHLGVAHVRSGQRQRSGRPGLACPLHPKEGTARPLPRRQESPLVPPAQGSGQSCRARAPGGRLRGVRPAEGGRAGAPVGESRGDHASHSPGLARSARPWRCPRLQPPGADPEAWSRPGLPGQGAAPRCALP